MEYNEKFTVFKTLSRNVDTTCFSAHLLRGAERVFNPVILH